MRALVAVLLMLLGPLQYRLWAGEESIAQVWNLRQAVDAQRAENALAARRNARLGAEVIDLKRGLEAVEERARRELGMTAVDETYYQFVESATVARP